MDLKAKDNLKRIIKRKRNIQTRAMGPNTGFQMVEYMSKEDMVGTTLEKEAESYTERYLKSEPRSNQRGSC